MRTALAWSKGPLQVRRSERGRSGVCGFLFVEAGGLSLAARACLKVAPPARSEVCWRVTITARLAAPARNPFSRTPPGGTQGPRGGAAGRRPKI